MGPSSATGRPWGEDASRPGLPPDGVVHDLFAWLAPSYDAAVNGYTMGQDLRWKTTLLRRTGIQPGERALDLACGTGHIQERLARRLGPRQVVGLDASRSMLMGRALKDRRVVLGNAEHLPFPAASFDVVTAGYLLKYVDLDATAREVARVLRPAGRFAGYDFSRPRRDRAIGRLYAAYLHRALPSLGALFARNDPGWPALMHFLGGLAETSGWEDRIGPAFEGVGFDRVRTAHSLGGAITWFWARRSSG
jgi:demethylmenaquinone methyltransferase / 2-methoxy-6-polyprenyl-1,4-benzoquinol methylase